MQVVRTEIVSDNIILRTIRINESNVSSVTYEVTCSMCNVADSFDNRPDALQNGRDHECEMGEQDDQRES